MQGHAPHLCSAEHSGSGVARGAGRRAGRGCLGGEPAAAGPGALLSPSLSLRATSLPPLRPCHTALQDVLKGSWHRCAALAVLIASHLPPTPHLCAPLHDTGLIRV